MAELRLKASQTQADRLPQICMACGQPAVKHVRRNFSWCPPWIHICIIAGVLPWAIIVAILTKRMWVDVPVCEKHRGYFWKRLLLMILPIVLLLGLSVGIAYLLSEMGEKDSAGLVCLGFGIALLAWIIVIGVIQFTMIRAKDITDRTITLVRIHNDFVTAFEKMQPRDDFDDEFDDDYPRRRRRRYRDEDDDDRPRQTRDDRTDIRAAPNPDDRTDIRAAEPDDRIRRDEN
jgi:hypothetical protein